MTQPTDPPAQAADSDTEPQQDRGPQLAAGAPAHHDKEQQIAWLRAGSETVHAPGTRFFPSRQAIGLSTLAIVVSGLAVGAIGHFLTPGPVTSQITAPTAARPQARPAAPGRVVTNAPPTVSPAPVATNVTSATAADAPAGPAFPALAPAAPKPDQHTPMAGGTTEHRSHGRYQPVASPPSPAPALPETTAARGPNSEDEDQDDTPQPAPPSQDQQSQWHWKKTTTCDSSGRCVDHYNPVPSDQ